jgi:hypothetical protein
MRSPKIEIYRSQRAAVRWKTSPFGVKYGLDVIIAEWRWRMRASNGRIISEGGEGYLEPRDLVRGLELAHPGWYLHRWRGETAWRMWDRISKSIPVTVPEGTEALWAARRNR